MKDKAWINYIFILAIWAILILFEENHFSTTNHVRKSYFDREFWMYLFTTYHLENCSNILQSSYLMNTDRSLFVLLLIGDRIFDEIFDVWFISYFSTSRQEGYNEIFNIYSGDHIVWNNKSTNQKYDETVLIKSCVFIRRLSNFWKRCWPSRYHYRSVSHWSNTSWIWYHQKFDTDTVLHIHTNTIQHYRMRRSTVKHKSIR